MNKCTVDYIFKPDFGYAYFPPMYFLHRIRAMIMLNVSLLIFCLFSSFMFSILQSPYKIARWYTFPEQTCQLLSLKLD